jgi:competence ComEA-like helix-hairpin-helix protein
MVKQQLQVNTSRKITINTATKDELKICPDTGWNLASAIVEYRDQHGPIKDVEELKTVC